MVGGGRGRDVGGMGGDVLRGVDCYPPPGSWAMKTTKMPPKSSRS